MFRFVRQLIMAEVYQVGHLARDVQYQSYTFHFLKLNPCEPLTSTQVEIIYIWAGKSDFCLCSPSLSVIRPVVAKESIPVSS